MIPDNDDLAYLAPSLLADETPPFRIHDAWRGEADPASGTWAGIGNPNENGPVTPNRGENEDPDDTDTRVAAIATLADQTRRRSRRIVPVAAATAVLLVVAGGLSFRDSGTERRISTLESGGGEHPCQEGPVKAEVELASVTAAIGGAMDERDLSALRDPGALEECLAEHGENGDALLGAVPATVEGRVRQLFVLATGIPGRVSVLVVTEGCGSEPGPRWCTTPSARPVRLPPG